MSDTLSDVAEDRPLRHKTLRGPARVKTRCAAHKPTFCRLLPETRNPYTPAVIEQPLGRRFCAPGTALHEILARQDHDTIRRRRP
jgi:hypothetical protein